MNINPFDLLKNAQSIKDQLSHVKDELKELYATGSAGGGIVKVTLNGHFEMQSVELDPVAVDPRDIPMLQDLIVAASKDALTRIQEQIKAKMGPLVGDLNIPGLDI
jgi:hypothetical protein